MFISFSKGQRREGREIGKGVHIFAEFLVCVRCSLTFTCIILYSFFHQHERCVLYFQVLDVQMLALTINIHFGHLVPGKAGLPLKYGSSPQFILAGIQWYCLCVYQLDVQSLDLQNSKPWGHMTSGFQFQARCLLYCLCDLGRACQSL